MDIAESKQAIRRELESNMQMALSSCAMDKPLSSEITQSISTVIEAIFIHGLRSAFFLKNSRHGKHPAPNFWPFVSKYTHKSHKHQIAELNQIRTEIGKARAWIRILLNENALENFLNIFTKDAQISQFYDKAAFLRDPECIALLNTCLKALCQIQISVPTNSSMLNTWTPSPLILAGLMYGKMTKATSITNSASNTAIEADEELLEADEPEMGMNALDLLAPTPSTSTGHLDEEIAQTNGPKSIQDLEESITDADGNESVLSHPSMLLEEAFFVPSAMSKFELRLPTIVSQILGDGIEDPSENFYQKRAERLERESRSPVLVQQHKQNSVSGAVEHHSAEVVVHRRKAGRRRAFSRSSGDGGSSIGGEKTPEIPNTNNNMSSSHLQLEEESAHPPLSPSMENIDAENPISEKNPTNAATKNNDEQTEDICQIATAIVEENESSSARTRTQPMEIISEQQRQAIIAAVEGKNEIPFGASLQEELLLAQEQEEKLHLDQQNSGKIPETFRPRKSSEPAQTSDANFDERKAAFIVCSTDSSTNDLPTTFDEALREFLRRESNVNGSYLLQRADSDKRLFSECSSKSGADANEAANFSTKESSSVANLSEQSQQDEPNLPDIVSHHPDVISTSVAHAAEKFIEPAKEMPQIPIGEEVKKRVEVEEVKPKEKKDDGEELVEIPLFNGAPTENLHWIKQPEPYKIQKRFLHLTQIQREQGLDKQNYRCKICRRNIGAGFGGPYKICALTGLYHCEHCIRGEPSVIPARAILNADFRRWPIGKESRTLLRSIADKPLFRVDVLNPAIYGHSRQMRKIRDLRKKLGLLVMYLLSCKNSVADDIKRRVWPHEHLHSDLHMYSLLDLECVANGTLERRINALISFAQSHVQNCALCMQKGFFCELCTSNKPIYPFQTELVYQCSQCSSCFHRECAANIGLPEAGSTKSTKNPPKSDPHQPNCPKCLRRAKYSTAALNSLGSPLSSAVNVSALGTSPSTSNVFSRDSKISESALEASSGNANVDDADESSPPPLLE